jgi:hypothetical protein
VPPPPKMSEMQAEKKFVVLTFFCTFFYFQGQFGYGGDDLWVNGGVPFTSASTTTVPQTNNNAYFGSQVNINIIISEHKVE